MGTSAVNSLHLPGKRPRGTGLDLGSPELGQAFVAEAIADMTQEVATS